MPSRRATASAVVRLSPVSMTMRMPRARSRSQRIGRGRLDRVGDGDDARRAAIDRDDRAPSRRPAAASRPWLPARRARCPRSCIRPRLPSATAWPSTVPVTPLPVTDWKSAGSASGRPRSRAAATIAAASGCSLDRSRLAASGSSSASDQPAAGTTAITRGLPSVSVPVLSTTSVSTFSRRSSASAERISTPAPAPLPTPTMIDIGVARPSAHGQAMISTETAAIRRIGEGRRRSPDRPGREGEQRDGDHRRHEPAGHDVGEALDRRARALRLGDHGDDAREHGVRRRRCRRA